MLASAIGTESEYSQCIKMECREDRGNQRGEISKTSQCAAPLY